MSVSTEKYHCKWLTITRYLFQVFALVVVLMILWQVTSDKFNDIKRTNSNYSYEVITAEERTTQLKCLASNIYHEAGNESFEGKVAVAQVTMNRVESGKFGKGVCGVIYQKNVFYEKVICQFSWVCMTAVREKPVHTATYEESEVVAKKVLLENFRLPSLEKALYYHADYINPAWGLPKITKIGRHIFYAEK